MVNSYFKIVTLLFVLLIKGCCSNLEVQETPTEKHIIYPGDLKVPQVELHSNYRGGVTFKIIEVDSCQWLTYNTGYRNGLMVHRTKCKYCKERK